MSLAKTPYLTGEVVDREADLQPLRDRIEELEADLRKMRQERDAARSEGLAAQSAIEALRDVLGPLRRAIGAIWGEIEASGVGTEPQGIQSPSLGREAPSSHKNEAWELWKQKLPGFPSRMIDALLKHGELSVAQLVVAAQCPRKQTIYDAASKMQRLGLLKNNSGKYKLSDL